ncbi:MAG: OmpA family protein [Saprospiraceae bacterium]
MHRISIYTFYLFLLPGISLAQKDHIKAAEIYMEAGKYREALTEFNAYQKIEGDPKLILKRGVCYYNTNQPDLCIKDMVTADRLKSVDNIKYKYTALSYMAKRDYSDAAKHFKMYLNTLKRKDKEWQLISDQIKRCGYSVNYKFLPQLAYVENLGSGINTVFDEFGVVQSPTRPERYYFSSAREGSVGGLRNKDGLADNIRGQFASDMYMADLIDGNWGSVLEFGTLLNSPKHDILQDFSQDGSVVYFTKGMDKASGVLYTDTFSIEKNPEMIPVSQNFPFRAENGDKDLFLFSDSLILFSSMKQGGYGGYDLYFMERKDNVWQNPVNFGPSVNTVANETAPYLIRSGNKLYFSSDRTDGYGGYDIFLATFSFDGTINSVLNVGYPINSPGNETDTEISYDGMYALFSSDRVEGYGGQDLYIAYFKDQVTGQLETVDRPLFLNHTDDSGLTLNLPVASDRLKDLPERDYVSRPLYFSGDEDVLNIANLNNLKSLSDVMLIYPEIKIDLYSHYLSEGKKEFDLYFSIKRAEKVSEYLIKSGIKSNRINMFGCGANYPLALPFINNISSTLAERSNKRIDIRLQVDMTRNLKVMYDYPIVAVQYRDTLWDDFNDINQQLNFRVVFTRVAQMLRNDIINLSNDVIIEKNASDNQYSYTMGNYLFYTDAKKMKNYLKSKGFENSEVKAYYHGTPMNKLDLISLSAEYPEINNYLSEEGQ